MVKKSVIAVPVARTDMPNDGYLAQLSNQTGIEGVSDTVGVNELDPILFGPFSQVRYGPEVGWKVGKPQFRQRQDAGIDGIVQQSGFKIAIAR